MGTEEWDVIVVGGGPGGSSAALAAASAGAQVLVVDRRETIGSPVQCAEFLARNVVLDLNLPQDAIAQNVERSRTFIFGEEASVRRNPGCILNRDVADAVLWDRASEAGAEARSSTRVTKIDMDTGDGSYGVVMTRDGEEHRANSPVLIGADGPRSIVGASLGISNHKMVVANQVTVSLNEPFEDTEVYLDPAFAGGYAWLFPKNEIANLGVGVDVALGASPMRALALFLELLGDRIGGMLRSTGGLIPVGGPMPMRMDRALLVGDAAGLTHPITGGGIHQAVESGRLAGKAAAAHLAGDDQALAAYEAAFSELFSIHLARAVERRREMASFWDGCACDPELFTKVARRGWIAFPDYYEKRGDDTDGA